MKLFLFSALLCLIPAPLVAQEKAPDAAALAKEVAPFLDDQLLAVATLDLTKVDVDATVRSLQKAGLAAKDLETPAFAVKQFVKTLAGGGIHRGYVVFSLADVPSHPPILLLPLAEDSNIETLVTLLKAFGDAKSVAVEKRGSMLVVASPSTLKRLNGMKPVARPELTASLSRLGDSAYRQVILPSDTLRAALEELAPKLPRELGGGPTAMLTRGMKSIAIGIDLPPKGAVRMQFNAVDEAAARGLQKLIGHALEVIAKSPEVRATPPDLQKQLLALRPRQIGDRVEVLIPEDFLVSALVTSAKSAVQAADQAMLMNNMKQVGLAFHSQASTNGDRLPAAANHDKQDKPLLSWRVHLLPYLEQDALYKQFRLDEAWDSEHNKKLIKQMPKFFATAADPKLAAEGKTTCVVPSGQGTLFEGTKGLRFQDVTDGTSSTLLGTLVEDDQAVLWTKPDDWKFDPKNPVKGLRKVGEKQFVFLLLDGSVRLVPATVDPKTVAALVTPTGGEPVNLP